MMAWMVGATDGSSYSIPTISEESKAHAIEFRQIALVLLALAAGNLNGIAKCTTDY
jgi:hypothetical protein